MILVVEDDEDVRDLVQFTLTNRGYPTSIVRNGAEALEFLARERPCLLILDLIMPVMTGWQVLDEMKARGVADIPVCVISALGDRIPPDAVATLSKPFDAKELLALAARYCEHTRLPSS